MSGSEAPRARGGAPGGAGPSVVAVGGGHGLAATLRAVRSYGATITAVVSVADDGGSSGRLRELLDVVALGDLRTCLEALADERRLWSAAFAHRFDAEELAGHALGNLVLAGLLAEADGDTVRALDEAGRLLGAAGRVLPATLEAVTLKAECAGGQVAGQVAIMGTDGIRHVSLVPDDPVAAPEAVAALAAADQIVLGPGSLFTSVLAATAVPGIREAVASSPARKVYVCNLRPQPHESEGFDVADHLGALVAHGVVVDTVLCDTSGLPLGAPDRVAPGVSVVDRPLARPNGLAHDPGRLAAALVELVW